MAKHTNLSSLFTAIADAIRAKKGLAAGTKIVADNFPEEIAGIETGRGVDLSVVDATSSDVLYPKKIVNSNGEPVAGTIATKSNTNLSVSGKTVTGPAGYYPDGISKSISDGALTDSVTISVNSSTGKITASSGVKTAGYLDTSAKTTGTKQLTTYTRTAAYVPTTSEQTAANAGTFLCSAVKIAGDPNLVSSNIKSGVSIFGVTGTYAGESGGSFGYYETQADAKGQTGEIFSFAIDGFDSTIHRIKRIVGTIIVRQSNYITHFNGKPNPNDSSGWELITYSGAIETGSMMFHIAASGNVVTISSNGTNSLGDDYNFAKNSTYNIIVVYERM